ncbi:MAG TPA: ROK family protein [Solirubrobacteraceae bacterium]|nr:ROK family protein [Solirubrobacteraceae bacterium]
MAAACVVGVDLGGTKALAGAVDASLVVHHRARREIWGLDQRALLDAVVEVVDDVRAAVPAEVEAVGLGIPCTFDRRTGIAVQAVNLPLCDLPFRDVMAERLGVPVVVDNDANAAVLAEQRHGAAAGASEVILLTVGTGIGGGIVMGGEVYRGSVGAAAELGHTVIDVHGPPCQGTCPNRGCLEVMASGTALSREAVRMAGEHPGSALGRALAGGRGLSGQFVVELAHDGDADASAVVARIGRHLGVGIANFVNVFNPEVVVVGGGVMAAGELLLGPAREEVASRALPPARDVVRIVPAGFGEEAGMVGAAVLVLEAAGVQGA